MAAYSPTTIASAIATIYIASRFMHFLRKRRANLKFSRENGCLPSPPTPALFPFNIPRIFMLRAATNEKRLINYVHEGFLLHGSTRKTRIAGKDIVLTCDPENIKTLLATSFKDFDLGSERHEVFSDLLGDGIFTSDGKVWEHARALLRPQFARDQIADLEDLELHYQNLLAILSPQDGEVVDLYNLFSDLTLDSATSFLFGKSVYSLCARAYNGQDPVSEADKEENRKFTDDYNYAQEATAFRLWLEQFRWIYRPRRLPRAIENVHRYVDKLTELAIRKSQQSGSAKRDDGKEKYVFLEALVQDTQDPKVLRDQLLSALLAGRDSTSGLLSWIFYLLARHPPVWKTLREEILNEIGRSKPTYQQLKDLRYLRWVINETMRLYPIVPVNFRMANKNTVLPLGGGPDGRSPMFVEKNMKVVYSVYALHRRKDIYGEDADEFRPERWGEGKSRGWEYLPFNGGPRICPGQQLALTTTSYIVVRLLQNFDRVENADLSTEVLTSLTITLSPANGTLVRIYKDRSTDA